MDVFGSFQYLNYIWVLFSINFFGYINLDYVKPLIEYNNLFIMTRFIETEQSLDSCDEVKKISVITLNLRRIFFILR